MPVGGCEDLVGVGEHGEGGTDVEEDCFLDARGVVDEEFVGDAGAAVVGADVVGWEVELFHYRGDVCGHGAFGVVLGFAGFGGGAVAADVEEDDFEMLG